MLNLRQQSVTVERQRLLTALTEGRARHLREYEEAMADYCKAVEKFLTDALRRVKIDCDFDDVVCRFQKPDCFVKEYERIIEMVKFSVDDKFTIDGDAFRAYFMGEWVWRQNFELTASSLKSYLGS